MDGYNGTVFAYGQTGSGKTFTMMVRPSLDSTTNIVLIHLPGRGYRQRRAEGYYSSNNGTDLPVHRRIRCPSGVSRQSVIHGDLLGADTRFASA